MIMSLFKLDLRSLALARVLLGVLTFFDLWRRLSDLDIFFTDNGILPRWVLLEQFELNWRMSLLSLNGSYSFALILALTGMLASLFFALGWRTRISNLIVWLTIISFQARFPQAATSGGDMLLRIFLFWSLFLPMNARYSVDHAVSENSHDENEFFSIFSSLWIVQIMLLYIFTFLYKWAPVYHTDFDAVWFMLQLDIFTTPIGRWLGQHYVTTKFLSFTSYALEIIGPLLLFIPWKRDLFRGIAVISFWLFHGGIGLTMYLGNFVPICLIIWVGLIPTAWWNYLVTRRRATTEALITLYYDKQSEFAKQFSLIAKELLMLSSVRVLPSETKQFILEDKNKEQITGFHLVPKLLLSSRFSCIRFIGRIVSSDLGLDLNDVKEAGEVNIFGEKRETPDYKHPPKIKVVLENLFRVIGFDKVRYGLNRVEKIFGGFLMVLIIGWNIEGFVIDRKWYIGSPFDEIMFALQLNQGWAMFAPHPQRSDGWWVMEGNLENGKKWDALNNKELNFDRPQNINGTYASEDWRKFLDNLQGSRSDDYLRLLGRFVCRNWNNQHVGEESLSTFKLYFMQEMTKNPNDPPAKVEKLTLWNHSCF